MKNRTKKDTNTVEVEYNSFTADVMLMLEDECQKLHREFQWIPLHVIRKILDCGGSVAMHMARKRFTALIDELKKLN